jgi:hypothetical protein
MGEVTLPPGGVVLLPAVLLARIGYTPSRACPIGPRGPKPMSHDRADRREFPEILDRRRRPRLERSGRSTQDESSRGPKRTRGCASR